jgi:hypothetical protein
MSEHCELAAGDRALAVWLGRLQETSFNRAGPAVRNAYPPERRMTGPQLAEYLARRTYALASSTRPDGRTHAAPTLFTSYAELRNAGASLDWATAWLRVTPRRLFSFAEHAWQNVSGSSSGH